MPETAKQAAPTPVRVSAAVKTSAPRPVAASVSGAWPAVSHEVPSAVQLAPSSASRPVGGEPLQQGMRKSLEEGFGVGLESVRVHSGIQAQSASRNLSARAFTYGPDIFLGSGERASDLHLMAHEVSHVVQQQGGASLQRWSAQQSDRFEREAQQASSAILMGQPFMVQERTSGPRVQRLGISDILDSLADLAANLPGFTLLTVIIGRNPINMRPVERNFTNLLRGFIGLIPGGEILFQILNRYGVVERLGAWVSEQVASLGLTYEYLRGRFTAFTDSLGFRDIFSPGDVWRRARDIFSEPINRIRSFISRLIGQAITWLKETFLRPLSDFCRQIPGYTLVTVLLGRDPFTNAAVPRTALNVVRAFAEFIPGGTERVNQLVESRALQRAYQWFIQETQARNLTWARVSGIFAQAWSSLRFEDVLHPIDTIQRIVNMFRPLTSDLVSFAGAALMKLLEFIFEAVMGAGGARVLAILRRARDTFLIVIRNPVGFLRNLLSAVGQGIRQFMRNILQHLQQGVIAWLTGPVARAGIQIPERWDLSGIIWFVLQILGLTWARIREKLVRLLGENVVAGLEAGFQLIQDIRQRGLVPALRDRVTEFFGQLREAALGSIRSFIQQRLVTAGITQLLSLLNPVGAIIQAIIKTYTTIQFFIQRMNEILDLVESIVNSISAIASGAIAQAANFVERTMARTIPVILDFLARFIGLGDIGGQVQRTIQSLQARVDAMLDRAVEWIRSQASRLGQIIVRGARGVTQSVMRILGLRKIIRRARGETHTLYFEQRGGRARLLFATNPILFIDWINSITRRPSLAQDQDYARRIIGQIDRLEDDSRNNNVDHNREITELLEELGRITIDLLGKMSRDYVRTTQPQFAGLRDGFGRGMRVTLSTDQLNIGTPPNPPPLPQWTILNRRRGATGAAYYVLGHLLNQQLGGSGTIWENLTPLSRSGNGLHNTRIESYIRPPRGGGELPRAFNYVVTPVYGRTVNTALITKINAVSNPDPAPTKVVKTEIARNEQYVPTALVCSIHEVDESGRQTIAIGTYPIPNEIEQNDPSEYTVV